MNKFNNPRLTNTTAVTTVGRSVVLLIKLTNLVSFMGCWRSRLAQEAYTFKVGGSSPSHPTLFNFKLNKYDEKVTNFCNDCRLSFFLS